MSLLLGNAVFVVELVHVARVEPDDQHVDHQRTLGSDPEAERPPEEREVQLAGEIPDDERHDEPYGQQKPGDAQVLLPVMELRFTQLHRSSPEDSHASVRRTDRTTLFLHRPETPAAFPTTPLP